MSISPFRLTIDTPSLYNKFKKNLIGIDTEVVHIEPTAYPNVLREVRHYVNAQNIEIRFRDTHDNVIHLFPLHKMVKAYFWKGSNLIQHLPTDLNDYEIQFHFNAPLTEADIKYIFTELKSAVKISIGNEFNVNGDLAERVKGLADMEKLKKLSVEINKPDVLNVQLTPFLETSPYLVSVDVVLPAQMKAEERDVFVSNQNVPSGWKLQRTDQFLKFSRV